MLHGEHQLDGATIRPSDDMHRASVQVTNERGEIIGVSRERVFLTAVCPRSSAEVTLCQRDKAVPLGNWLSLSLPNAVVRNCPVDEYHWCSPSLLYVREADATHAHCLGRWRRHGNCLSACVRRRQNDDC